ncbi:hypothetical protein EZJ43_13650 [Pedobacter changchengzhani]|uniref:Restriction endonuclease n=1 Tax=Pedobacter changchengzhani TaxID=2529274 RepID=A0A4R5MJI0_9SPHI|nr:hypothetical protein [Pedobacter changchengzhani]TDG35345.1 hypothetical protein EZJ43_13650 [Pedobacter changchengzhani]
MFNKLQFIHPNIFNITKRKEFVADLSLNGYVDHAFEFAFNMTFGAEGHHRDHRTGGQHQRQKAELFINAFQGKLAEFGVYRKLTDNKIDVNKPDLRIMGAGLWDDFDFICGSKKISVKSAAHFSNLMLLEQKDWSKNGAYIPNLEGGNSQYDYFIFCRIKPDGKQMLRDHKDIFLKDEVDKIELKRLIINGQSWLIDIAGFIAHEDLVSIINGEFILPQKALLNGKTEMDAANYYVQSGDLHPLSDLVTELKSSI